jgi:cytochrome b6-f complex iron-sulfur subunit
LATQPQSRRDFLSTSLGILPWAFAGTLAYPTGRFLFFQEHTRGKISIPLKQLNEGITPFLKSDLYIYKSAKTIQVYDAHCTHMGCIIHFDKDANVFNCPCHKSRFDAEGHKLRGPAKRDLNRVTYEVKNNTLMIG